MLGLPKGQVFLLDSSEQWHRDFQRESEAIENAIGESVIGIHHIGSTAIPGLKAKPIIDIAIELEQFDISHKNVNNASICRKVQSNGQYLLIMTTSMLIFV